MPPKPKDIPGPSFINVPASYFRGSGDGDTRYLVPQYLVPDLDQAFVSYQKSQEIGAVSAQPAFNNFDCDLETEAVAGGLVVYPANPILSDQERLLVHAEILALQERLGISYKDASHWLYMAEVEKLKAVDRQCKALANLSACIEASLRAIQPAETPNPDTPNPDTDTQKVADSDAQDPEAIDHGMG